MASSSSDDFSYMNGRENEILRQRGWRVGELCPYFYIVLNAASKMDIFGRQKPNREMKEEEDTINQIEKWS